MTMTAQEGHPPLSGGVFRQHSSAGFQTTLQVSEQLGIDHETVRRITQQLVDLGSIRDRRINGKGMHLLNTYETSLIQNMHAKANHPQPEEEKESEKTTMPATNKSKAEHENETPAERECRERFGTGSGRRLDVDEMAQAAGLSPASVQSYIYRNLLPRRKDLPTTKNPRPAWHFFESDARIFRENQPAQPPQLAKAQKKEADVQPQKQEATMTQSTLPSLPAPAAPTKQEKTALVPASEVEAIDVTLVDPRGLENATKLARLFSYLFTRVGAIKIDGLEEVAVRIKLEPDLQFTAEDLGISISPKVTYWEVYMTTAAHPDSSEAYQVVLSDRFHHVKVETDPNA